jgi:hypothetical protein
MVYEEATDKGLSKGPQSQQMMENYNMVHLQKKI